MIKNPIVRNILSALAIAVCGYMLLNLTFLFAFLFFSAIQAVVRVFTPLDITTVGWVPPTLLIVFLIVIGVITWFVLKSKMRALIKAIYVTVPIAVAEVTIGILLFQWPEAIYGLGGLFFVVVLYYLYRSKAPWFYYFSLILVSLSLVIMGITGVEI